MPRTFTAFCVLLATSLAPAGVAAAQDCLCLMPGHTPPAWQGWLEASASPRVPQSIEVGPVFSSDGELLVSDAAREAGARDGVTRARRAAPVEVLWCVSADDPRCSPRDEAPNDGPRSFEGSHGAGPAIDSPRLATARPRAVSRPVCDGLPRPERRGRVERPPRV